MYEEQRVIDHLKTLSVCYYVYAALSACASCLGVFYAWMGGMFGELMRHAPQGESANPPPPEVTNAGSWLFIIFGVAIIVVSLTLAVLCFLSARAMTRRQSRTFSLVVAGIVCLTGLLGVALGVFTFIVLLKPEAQRLYAGAPPAP
jgi:threonine/homoserine/homoserine lactone efflux protein